MESIGNTILITGGSRGLGFACAERLLGEGYRVAILDVGDRSLKEAESRLGPSQERLLAMRGSVSSSRDAEMAVATVVDRWGRLDSLVNNAGINRPGGMSDQSEPDWDDTIEVNLKGVFLMSQHAAPELTKSTSASIVNISSVAATGRSSSPAYVASKSGLIGLSKRMATEWGPLGITVNIVAPGVTMTDWVANNVPESYRETTEANTPLRRLGRPDEVAAAVSFFLSDDARFLTGQTLSVSGGFWMP